MKKLFVYFFSIILLAGIADAESLWLKPTNDERGIYSRNVASRIGDIVTVNVSESVSINTDGSHVTTAGKSSVLQSEFVKIINGAVLSKFNLGNDSDGNPVNIDLGQLLDGGYDGGEGNIKTEMSISTVPVTVQVIDTLPNGNLVIEGARVVSISDEKLYAVLRGIIRIPDIENDNTIPSSRIASASIEFISEGSLSDVQTKGWFTQMMDSVNPF